MSGYFLDSSAVAKIYHVEVGTPTIQSLVSRTDSSFYISRLAVVEVPSAFAGKVRTGEINAADLGLLRTRFRLDLRRKMFRTVAMTAGHFRDAEQLIRAHGVNIRLRTLDALQLAVALYLQKRGLVETLVSADKALCQVAEVVGLIVVNPETTSLH